MSRIRRHVRPIYSDTYAKRRKWLTAAGVAVGLLLLVAAGVGWHWWQARRGVAQYAVKGVVLSQADGYQDFSVLSAAGVDFAYLKATQGASFFDDDFTPNYDRGRGSAVRLGVYHYFSFDSAPEAQAAHFVAKVGKDLGTLPVGLYVTYYGAYAKNPPAASTLRAQLTRFITTLHQATGKTVVLMGSPSVLAACQGLDSHIARWVISDQRPKQAAYWQTGTWRLDGADYTAAAFTGSQRAFDQQ
ncbi:GH25 family lysozyme [Lacticaseibacillus daqingensis]|uniref:GH25 family lysozyme n=1 Tax=Lacticaseibacillus daqingensis TaxID=2486014 RepID=UPI000F7ADC32|nr:GH25 family lysozyme [Lacticaseibacillus daqingensis]